MDGLLVIDKPSGPTSHDVVARTRRALRERRVGHTGTLDPMATGVLPLVLGRATRLAQFISGSGKGYRAVLRLGVRTDSGDAEGEPVGDPWTGPLPDAAAIEAALAQFRGSFLQQPPAFSARKIAGRRSYDLARAARLPASRSDPGVACAAAAPAERPAAANVTVERLEVAALDGDRLTLNLDCSAGFYVRALADDLGRLLGVGAHLVELRRTRHGEFTTADALPLTVVEQDPAAAAARILPMRRLLTTLGAVMLTPEGLRFAAHGRDLEPEVWTARAPHADAPTAVVRLLSADGDLVGIARPTPGRAALHPFVVLM
jgi:tRNA pseudouridine55 synthase